MWCVLAGDCPHRKNAKPMSACKNAFGNDSLLSVKGHIHIKAWNMAGNTYSCTLTHNPLETADLMLGFGWEV